MLAGIQGRFHEIVMGFVWSPNNDQLYLIVIDHIFERSVDFDIDTKSLFDSTTRILRVPLENRVQ